jgi:tetratricopeptide (TPR) repeat protein
MRNSTIYSIAAICGLATFFYTLIAKSESTGPSRMAGGRGYQPIGDNLPESIPGLESIVKTNALAGNAWYKLAEKYRDAGNEGAALDAWMHAAPIKTRRAQRGADPDAWFEAGWANHMAGDDEAAKPILVKAEELLTKQAHDLNSHETWRRLGWARKLLGQDTDARIAWARAIDSLPPKDAAIAISVNLYNLACYRCLSGEPEEALDVLKRAVSAGWNDADHTEHDEDFEAMRDDPRFKSIVLEIRQKAMGVRIDGGP